MNFLYGKNPIDMSLSALIVIVYLVRNVSTAMDSASECPVRIRRGHSTSSDSSAVPGSCECSALMEIRCSGGLQAFPEFVPTTDVVVIRGLYAPRQAIAEIPDWIFFNARISVIVANFNPIGNRIGPKAFAGLEQTVKEIQLGGCGIRTLPEGLLTGMDELLRLHLWANQISRFPLGFLKAARNLRELILWGNEIVELEDHTLAGLWKLRRLDLDRNRISSLSKHAFRNLIELEVLHLGENNITAIYGDTFFYMGSLRVLSLDRNNISFIYSKAFDGLENLVVLALNDNRINFIPDDLFRNLRNLTHLWLQNNTIEYIWTKTFIGLNSLHGLELSSNHIGSLPDGAFRHSPRLRHLVLDDNRLRTFSRCVLPKRTRLRTLSIVGNPVRCDCKMTWVADMCSWKSAADGGDAVWGACLYESNATVNGSPVQSTVSSLCRQRDQASCVNETTQDCHQD